MRLHLLYLMIQLIYHHELERQETVWQTLIRYKNHCLETRSRCGAVDKNTTMNKASYKLKGLPQSYCINLDGEPERWESAENMFKEWE